MTRHAIALAVIAGLALRLALLIGSGWRYDYDEGMAGLQALHILGGERPVFHPGQPYLGAAESYLLAGLFALFGPGAVTLKLAPWLLAGVYIALTGWLGARIFGPRAGALSGLLAALAPAYLLVTGLKSGRDGGDAGARQPDARPDDLRHGLRVPGPPASGAP